MTASILAIVAALVGITVWAVRRRASRLDSPTEQHKRRYEAIDRSIVEGDGKKAGTDLAYDLDALDRLKRLQDGKAGGSGHQV